MTLEDNNNEVPRCCVKCFDDSGLQKLARDSGSVGDCDFCKSEGVATLGVETLADVLQPLLAKYHEAAPGVRNVPGPEGGDNAWSVGKTLDVLVDEDHPELFSDHLRDDDRRRLLQAMLNAIDRDGEWDGHPGRDVDASWTRRGNELWTGFECDDDLAFRSPPKRWREFVLHIRSVRRFVRDGELDTVDPRSYLTDELLKQLLRPIKKGEALYRAVAGGVEASGATTAPHPAERMMGPRSEHCRRGGRVNPPGIPMLYLANDVETVIAEIRPYKGAPVTVATFVAARDLSLVDFSPRKNKPTDFYLVPIDALSLDTANVLNTIGFEMAEPVDPNASEVAYVPTQYVAEVVRAMGYDGLAFRSALGPGTNIVLFNLTDATMTNRELYRVKEVSYRAEIHEDTF